MNKDTREALERLEAELLAGEDLPNIDDDELDILLEEFLEEEEPEVPVTGVRAYNTDQTDLDLDIYSDQVYEEPQKPGHGLTALALLSIAVSAAALVYMVLRLM